MASSPPPPRTSLSFWLSRGKGQQPHPLASPVGLARVFSSPDETSPTSLAWLAAALSALPPCSPLSPLGVHLPRPASRSVRSTTHLLSCSVPAAKDSWRRCHASSLVVSTESRADENAPVTELPGHGLRVPDPVSHPCLHSWRFGGKASSSVCLFGSPPLAHLVPLACPGPVSVLGSSWPPVLLRLT